MYYALICNDKPGSLEVRMSNRPAHLDFLKSLGSKLIGAGPFMDPEEKPCGSLIILAVQSQSEAEATAAKDPYALAGLFASVEVRPWNWVINPPSDA